MTVVPGSRAPAAHNRKPIDHNRGPRPRAGPVDDGQLAVGSGDRVGGDEVRVHERVGQVVAAIRSRNLVPKAIEQPQLADSDSGQVVLQ
jgi:hypothetical protein